MSGVLSSAGFFNAHAAFAGPYVNLEANGSYPGGDYESGNLEAQVGYEGTTTGGLDWYVSAGPTVSHTESSDDFGDVELAGYLGASKAITESVNAYGEVYGQTTDGSDNEYAGKVGVKFVF